jgi:hypothetical protein
VLEFAARCVAIEDDAATWQVLFADEEFNSRRYLLLRRAREPTAEDVEFGLDGYAVEVNDPSHAAHGGIAQFELHRDRVVVGFDEAMVQAFGVDAVNVSFALRDRQFAELRDRLTRLFAGDDCYLDCAP